MSSAWLAHNRSTIREKASGIASAEPDWRAAMSRSMWMRERSFCAMDLRVSSGEAAWMPAARVRNSCSGQASSPRWQLSSRPL